MQISPKHFIFGIISGIVLLFVYLFTFPDNRLHIVFCNIGQGDAAYIRTPSKQDVLIDGGPNDKVLSCLGRHMPFYDRTIDIIMLSHPQKDHFQGLISVVERYKVNYFILGVVGNQSQEYQRLVTTIKEKRIPIKNLYKDDKFSLAETEFKILWPEREWLAQTLATNNRTIEQLNDSKESVVLGLSTSGDLNHFSFYVHLKYGSFDTLFTGDGDSRIQPDIIARATLPEVELLKFPHHGSKYGATLDFLKQVSPELAVISVGKNPWGHPTKEAIKMLDNQAIKILRTDQDGDIEVVSDGKDWWVK